MPVVPVDIIEAGELGPEHIGRTVEFGGRFTLRGELTSLDEIPGKRHKMLLIIRDEQVGPVILTLHDTRYVRVWVE